MAEIRTQNAVIKAFCKIMSVKSMFDISPVCTPLHSYIIIYIYINTFVHTCMWVYLSLSLDGRRVAWHSGGCPCRARSARGGQRGAPEAVLLGVGGGVVGNPGFGHLKGNQKRWLRRVIPFLTSKLCCIGRNGISWLT